MTNGDIVRDVQEDLGIPEDSEHRSQIDADKALEWLRKLSSDIQHSQRAIGMILWHLDPEPGQLSAIAELLHLKTETLKSWLTTYSRLRHDANTAAIQFSMQQQLARIQNAEDRLKLWNARPHQEWTLSALTEAVDAYLADHGMALLPKVRKAGCRARYDEEHQVKANLELLQDAVVVTLKVAGDADLSNMRFERISEGVYQIKFDW